MSKQVNNLHVSFSILSELEFGAATETSTHLNWMPFSGVLCTLDEPSTRPPSGARGHLVQLPKIVAKRMLKSLIGMGLNYSDDLKSHAPKKKVGVIQKAWIDGNKLRVSGGIWKKDFPETIEDLKGKKGLGMSYEMSDVAVDDTDADVWIINQCVFTGATILYKDAAAYQKTSAIAARAELVFNKIELGGKGQMAVKKNTKKISSNAGDKTTRLLAAATEALQTNATSMSKFTKGIRKLSDRVEALEEERRLSLIDASGEDEDEDEDSEIDAEGEEDTDVEDEDDSEDEASTEEVKATKKKKKDDDDDDDDDDDEEDDEDDEDDDMDSEADLSEDVEEDENLNPVKKVKNKGKKTSPTGGDKNKKAPLGGKGKSSVQAGSFSAALDKIKAKERENKQLRKQIAAQKQKTAGYKKQVNDVTAHAEKSAEKLGRRSLSPLTVSLLAKGGVDVGSLSASGEKLTYSELNDMFANSGHTDPKVRMGIKMELAARGLMEENN